MANNAGMYAGLGQAAKDYAAHIRDTGAREAGVLEKVSALRTGAELEGIRTKNTGNLAASKMQLDYSIMDEKAKRDWQIHREDMGIKQESNAISRKQAESQESYQQGVLGGQSEERGQKSSAYVLGGSHGKQYGGQVDQERKKELMDKYPGLSWEDIAKKEDLIASSTYEFDLKTRELAARARSEKREDKEAAASLARKNRLMLDMASTGAEVTKPFENMLGIIAEDQVRNGDWNLKPKDYADSIKASNESFIALDQDSKDSYTVRAQPMGLSGQALYAYENLNTLSSQIPSEGTGMGQEVNKGVVERGSAMEQSAVKTARDTITSMKSLPEDKQISELDDLIASTTRSPAVNAVYVQERNKFKQDKTELTPAFKGAISNVGQVATRHPAVLGAKVGLAEMGVLGSYLKDQVVQTKKGR